MKNKLLLFCLVGIVGVGYAQKSDLQLHKIHWSQDSLHVLGVTIIQLGSQQTTEFDFEHPISLLSDSVILAKKSKQNQSKLLHRKLVSVLPSHDGFEIVVEFKNESNDTVSLQNVLPFEINPQNDYITGKGDHPLSRTYWFRPNNKPVNVIVPDNAWELGYNQIQLPQNRGYLYGLSRRDKSSLINGKNKRFETDIYPHGSIQYHIWLEAFKGNAQVGIKKVFQDRKLYDINHFNDSLYRRKDLEWVRHSYLMHLMMSWDQYFYDPIKKQYAIKNFVSRGQKLYGGDDVIAIWPTWPTLGLDQRNQFDLFKDLPGGLPAIQKISDDLKLENKHLFVSYNPWDVDTRKMNHYKGLSWLIDKTHADGVVLDTQGSSSEALQKAADSVRKGVIMYSEGMAVPKDMQGIISGRVHNALYYPPMLNLNKYIQPGFAIFRVAELYKEPINREFCTSFFNGYGTEINIMSPGQPEWVEKQYELLGKTTRLLRQLSDNFNSPQAIPLCQTVRDDIWVNAWPTPQKEVFTIYSTIPQGYRGYLFIVSPKAGWHFVDVFHHTLLKPRFSDAGNYLIQAETDAFHQKYLGTNNEGAVDCIIQTPELIQTRLVQNSLEIKWANMNTKGIYFNAKDTYLQIWKTEPSYTQKPVILKSQNQIIDLKKYFDRFEGKLVIQLMQNEEGRETLLDETIVELTSGVSRLTSNDPQSTNKKESAASNANSIQQRTQKMVLIPSGNFKFHQTHGDDFISYPPLTDTNTIMMNSFYMDTYPVTNKDFEIFIQRSHYKPTDAYHFLQHWVNGKPLKLDENKPVVYISYEDAQAYAKFYGKQLPTEKEWQYAAQTSALNEWPWKQSTPVTRTYEEITNTLNVIQIKGIDSVNCNLGNGHLDPVGTYTKGLNPNGLSDLVGSVWQLTNDEYSSGSYKYIIMKGGSYFKPSGSWWYVQGGPRELTYAQYLLRVSPGFERNATVGFRCILKP